MQLDRHGGFHHSPTLTLCQSASRNGKIIQRLTGWKYISVMKHFRVLPHTPFPSIALGCSQAIMKTIAQKSILVFITRLLHSCSLPVVPAHRPSEAQSHYFICSMLGPLFFTWGRNWAREPTWSVWMEWGVSRSFPHATPWLSSEEVSASLGGMKCLRIVQRRLLCA